MRVHETTSDNLRQSAAPRAIRATVARVPAARPEPPDDSAYPRPVKLPGNMPAGAHTLEGHRCPSCNLPFLYAHCGQRACCMLWCPVCKLVHRPDFATSYRRGALAVPQPDEGEQSA